MNERFVLLPWEKILCQFSLKELREVALTHSHVSLILKRTGFWATYYHENLGKYQVAAAQGEREAQTQGEIRFAKKQKKKNGRSLKYWQKKCFVQTFKDSGNAFLAQNQLEKAHQSYSHALKTSFKRTDEDLINDASSLFSNRSATRLKLGNYQGALLDADRSLALCPRWAKGYFRRAAALEWLLCHPLAQADFKESYKYLTNRFTLQKIRHASTLANAQSPFDPFF